MTALRFAPKLSLPLDAVTQRFGFLGRIGSGKSYASTKMAELFHDAGAQFVALDPVGIWYGLRVDGKGRGLGIPIFGGLHGDVPLEAGAGALMADLIVDRRLSCVLDVSQFESDREKARFTADFLKRFYFRKKAAPSAVHLFFEECQEFFPQNPQRGEEQMLHDGTRMAKLGRNFGIGMSLNSQRPQEVNKKVLNLTECLFAFQMTGVHERKAIKDWVSAKGADDRILDILPTLAVGVAHVYSPQWLRISEQVKCYEKRSADVSSTPEVDVDAAPIETKPLGEQELVALRGQMAATIEKRKADDPAELRKRIAELEREVKKGAPARMVERPVVDPRAIQQAVYEAVRAHEKRYEGLRLAYGRLLRTVGEFAGKMVATAGGMSEVLKTYGDALQSSGAEQTGEARTGMVRPSVVSSPARVVDQGSRAPARSIAPSPSRDTALTESDLPKGQQKLVDAAARLASMGVREPTRTQLAVLAPMSPTSSTTELHFGALIKAGLFEVADAGRIRLTDAGRAVAAPVTRPPTLDEYHDAWRQLLSGSEVKLFDAMASYPMQNISRVDLATRAHVSSTSSTTETAFSWLIGLELLAVAGKGLVTAGPTMFPEGLL